MPLSALHLSMSQCHQSVALRARQLGVTPVADLHRALACPTRLRCSQRLSAGIQVPAVRCGSISALFIALACPAFGSGCLCLGSEVDDGVANVMRSKACCPMKVSLGCLQAMQLVKLRQSTRTLNDGQDSWHQMCQLPQTLSRTVGVPGVRHPSRAQIHRWTSSVTGQTAGTATMRSPGSGITSPL